LRLIACSILLTCLLVPLVQAEPTPGAGGQAMPPHPRLKEAIERGEVSLPRFMTDPDLAHTTGVDRSQGRVQALTGSINTLAVLVDFSDKVHTVSATFFDSLIFAAPVAGRGSVWDYYDEISYQTVDIVTVDLPSDLGWQRAPGLYSNYVGAGYGPGYCTDSPYPHNCQKLAEDIVDAIDSVVDFSDYDNDGDRVAEPILLIHAGKGAEFTGDNRDIWSHSWWLAFPRTCDGVIVADYAIMPEYRVAVNGYWSDMTIGVFVHEMAHGFWGLTDLYDRDYSSEGVGNWSLMGSGSWNGPSSDGSSPAWPDAWSRVRMGFATQTLVTNNISEAIIPRALNPLSVVFKLHSDTLDSQEYFLVENRQRASGTYDQYLPGDGLLIWHVDEAMNHNDDECTSEPHCLCNDNRHYLVALEQADGSRDLERNVNSGDDGDPFPGNLALPNTKWTMTTNPESSSWYGSGPTCTNTCIGVTGISDSHSPMWADLLVTCGPPPNYQYVYLPLVLKNHGGLINGDFEAGATGWTTYSSIGWPIIIKSGFPTGVTPHGGSWAAWLGRSNNETTYIEQQVFIPAGARYLSYYHWIDSEDLCGSDWASVRIGSQIVDQYDLCFTANTSGWVKHTLSLGDYAGQSVRLQIRVQTDSSLYSSLFIDDLAFTAGAAAGADQGTAAPARAMPQPESYQPRQAESHTAQRSRHVQRQLDTWIEK
jgi:immune inhibitor A